MPAARRSNSDAMITILCSAAIGPSAAVVGPGIGSARSKNAWSSDWQKYCDRNSSGRQTTSAPRWAASRTRAIAFSRLAARSVEQLIWTRPSVKALAGGMTRSVLFAAKGELQAAATPAGARRSGGHRVQDVGQQAVSDLRSVGLIALGVGQDARAAVRAVGQLDEGRVLAHPGRDHRRVELAVKLQGVTARPQPERLVRADLRRRQMDRAGRQVERVAVPVQHHLARAQAAQRRLAPDADEVDRRPADLAPVVGIDARAGAGRHQLRAEADAQRRLVALGQAGQKLDLARQERMARIAGVA